MKYTIILNSIIVLSCLLKTIAKADDVRWGTYCQSNQVRLFNPKDGLIMVEIITTGDRLKDIRMFDYKAIGVTTGLPGNTYDLLIVPEKVILVNQTGAKYKPGYVGNYLVKINIKSENFINFLPVTRASGIANYEWVNETTQYVTCYEQTTGNELWKQTLLGKVNKC